MKERIAYIDALKVIACFAVINLHCTSPWVSNFLGSPLWFVAMGNAVITHLAVPMFFMLAGAVIPERIDDIGQHYRKTLWRYVVPTLLSLVLYKILGILLLDQRDYLAGVFYNIGSNPGFHLWFMWIYIGYMVVLPVLVVIARDNTARNVFIYSGIFFVFIVPFIAQWLGIIFPVKNIIFTVYGLYFITGHHLAVSPSRFKSITLLKWFSIAYIATYATATISSYDDTLYLAKFLTKDSILIFALTSIAFLLIKQTCNHQCSILTTLSKHTFNIYLLHAAFFLKPFSFLAFPSITLHGLAGSIFVTTPVTFILCLCISVLLSIATRFVTKRARPGGLA